MRERRVDVYTTALNSALIAAVLGWAIVEAAGGVRLGGASVAGQLWSLILFAIVCGLASAATIEILKRVAALRGRYQERETERWLEDRGQPAGWKELLRAMSLHEDGALRLFNLPAEQLVAQIGAAAQVAMASPDQYKALLLALGASRKDPEAPAKEDERRVLATQAELAIDQLQISLVERWRRYVQGVAVWVAGAYGIGLAHALSLPDSAEAVYILAGLIVGGALAWTSRDLAAAAERARR